jgi:ankyrin repeat protein
MLNKKLLFECCEKNNSEGLKNSLNTITDINEKEPENGWSLLSVSAFHHSIECVKLLLDNNANINSISNKGTSVLMYAKTKVFENRNFDFLNYLIERGADVNIKDNFGKDILDYVKEKEDEEMIEYFSTQMTNSRK